MRRIHKSCRRLATLLLIGCCGSSHAAAAVLHLKSGERVEGTIISRDERKVTVQVAPGGQAPYWLDEIERIEEDAPPDSAVAVAQPLSAPAMPLDAAPPQPPPGQDRATLEERVREVLAKDNVSQRSDIEAVFQLAELLSREGNTARALEFYEAGLRVDSWRLEYQLRTARLLLALGRRDEALEKAKTVSQYTELPEVMKEAEAFLAELGAGPAPAVAPAPERAPSAEIVLVPIGGIRRWLLEEFRQELEGKIGMQFSIAPYDLDPGPVDRTYAGQALAALTREALARLPADKRREALSEAGVKEAELSSPKNQQAFIESVLRSTNGPEAVEMFRQQLGVFGEDGQYDADRLIQRLQAAYPVAQGGRVRGYLGVTESDLFSRDNNFVFGWAQPGYGAMSYHRFLAAFTGEPPNRPRLRARFVKQAISSAFFVLGIPRCTSAVCVRAYPDSLTEHDQKTTELCAWCKEQLRAKIGPL